MFNNPLLNIELKKEKRKFLSEQRKYITKAGLKRWGRKSIAYTIWCRYILKKFNYRCGQCGSMEHLHIHHLKEWANNKPQRVNKDNGIVLCYKCHFRIHPFMYKYYNQLREKRGTIGGYER